MGADETPPFANEDRRQEVVWPDRVSDATWTFANMEAVEQLKLAVPVSRDLLKVVPQRIRVETSEDVDYLIREVQ